MAPLKVYTTTTQKINVAVAVNFFHFFNHFLNMIIYIVSYMSKFTFRSFIFSIWLAYNIDN